MQIVALLKPPRDPAAAAAAISAVTGAAPAEARMRVAPEPPALLARLPPEQAQKLVQALRQAGMVALAIDEARAGEGLLQVRTFELQPQAIAFTNRTGESELIAGPEVLAILRGTSAVREHSERTVKETKFSPMKAALGVGLTTTRERTVRGSSEETEQSIYVFAHDGRGAILRETALQFAGLGPLLGPSRTANMGVLAQQLKGRAPNAFYDERLMRLGRRPLPFTIGGEMQVSVGAKASQARTDTAGGLDLLAEVLRAAVMEKLLP